MTDQRKDGISWTDETWGPIRGCSKVSTGCKNCYAESMAARFCGEGMPYHGLARDKHWTGDVRFIPEKLSEPLRWKRPRRIFVNSMSDLFHESLTNEQIAAIFGVMAACPRHTFQVLTKRAKRMAEWFAIDGIAEQVDRFKYIALAGRISEYFAPECRAPVVGFPGYFVTNKGAVLTAGGSDVCLWCGSPNKPGSPKKKFCSQLCATKAGYERRLGRWSEPPTTLHQMSPDVGEYGHSRVMLYREDGSCEKPLIHHLVLSAFDRPSIKGEQCAHGDGNAMNNALWNLRWDTQSGNFQDKNRHGTRRSHQKLSPDEVEAIRASHATGVTAASLGKRYGVSDTQILNIAKGRQWAPEYAPEWPLRSIHLGVSCEDQVAANERIPYLLQCPAAVRWVSAEPLLGPIDFSQMRTPLRDSVRIYWVVVGGESGPRARPMHPDWARSIRDQCKAAGVPFHFKQWGEWAPGYDEHKFTYGREETQSRGQPWLRDDGEGGWCWVYDDDGTWQNHTGDPGPDMDRIATFHRHATAEHRAMFGHLLDGHEYRMQPGDKWESTEMDQL